MMVPRDRQESSQNPGSSQRQSDRRRRRPRLPEGRSRFGRVMVVWIAALAILIGAIYLLLRDRGPGDVADDELAMVEGEASEVAGERAIVLVFPNWDATGYILEQRQVPSRQRLELDLLAVMGALCAGPRTSGAVAALPSGTRPLAAFYNESDGSVVLDFSRELVINHPGGSAAESGTLTAILRTVALNFPEVLECQLLVDGAQSETLAGHLSLDRPFVPRRWL